MIRVKHLKGWLFYFWMRIAVAGVSGMARNSSYHSRKLVANRVTHTIRKNNQEFVFTWADLNKPSGLSREEIVAMEQILTGERTRQ